MTSTENPHSLRYLPVDVSGQLFAIPMSSVATIHRIDSTSISGETNGIFRTNASNDTVVIVIDLRRLFWGITPSENYAHAVVIATDDGMCAMLVDAVKPTRVASPFSHHDLPRLVTGERLPFSGVIREPDSLLLVIDGIRLVEQLSHVVPDAVLEQSHAV
jgi:chemotaxis signal transduction protein